MKSASPFQRANWLSVSVLALVMLFSCEQLAQAAHVTITTQPHDTNVLAGSNATYTVVASGTAPLRYRWRFNGTNLTNGGRISGATNSTLLITAVVADDAGGYRVVVSNSVSSVTSVVATLTVQFPPAISDIPNQRTFHGIATHAIPFTISNVPAPVLSAGSSNPSLVPTNNIIFSGSGSNWNVTITPAGSSLGTATITVTVTDQNGRMASKSFLLTVGDFSEVPAGLPNAYYGTVRWVDYDNDGYLDLFLSGYDTNYVPHTWLFHNNHDGTFAEVATPFPNWADTSADWADFDNDGYLDLVIKGSTDPWNGYSGAQVFRNLGGTNFVLVTSLPAYYNGGSITWADFDNDGKPDILLSTGNFTLLCHNNGDGTFSNIYQLPGGTSSVADYDNDGWLDVLLSGSYPLGTKLYHNTGTNAFTDSGWTLIGFYNNFSAWGDYNNDGWPDLLLSGGSDSGYGTNLLFRNNSGTLTNVHASFAPLRDGAVAWGDFDNDGNLDFFSFGLIVGCCYQSTLYYNAATNNAFADFGFTMPGVSMGAAAWGDYDNDGALDLIYMGRNSSGLVTKLYHNDGAMPDHPPTAPTGLTVTRGRNSALLSWSASTDPEQSGGLTYNVRIGTSNSAIDILSPLSDPATGFRRVPKTGNAGYRTSFLITNLPAGTYYWSVQAIDNAFTGSPFATEQSFNLPAPAITNQPQSLTILAGSQVVLQVGATGEPPLFFKWSLNGTNLTGATNSTLTLTNVQHADSGAYAVTVSNLWGVITSSNAVLTVNTPPVILAQPQNVTVIEGQSASFSVLATGDAPLTYQWSFNGTNLVDATNATLNLTAVVPSQAGAYSVLITNLSGATNSVSSTLTVPPSLPFILAQPQSQYVPAGLGVNANFSVTVVGTTPLSCQWRFNGTNIAGATQPFLTITNVQTTDAGAYSVLITNSVGPTLSQDATLSVMPAASSTNKFIPFGSVTDFIYDDLRDILYIVTGGSDVQRYQVGTASFLTPFSISGSLANLDLSPDGNLLAVADQTSGTNAQFYLVDLNASTVRQAVLTNFSGYVYSLAFGKDGAVVCEVGNLIVRYDPATGISSRRNIVYTSSGPMTASADRSTIGIIGLGAFAGYAGLVFTYNVTNQGIDGYEESVDYILAPPEISRDGGLVAEATSYSLLVSTNNHNPNGSDTYVASIGNPSGFVFSPNQDLLFCGTSNSRELHGYETAGFSESFILDFGTNITSSRMRVSRDGSKLFGAVSGGINWISWMNFAPSFLSQPTNQTVFAGSNVTFATRVIGSPTMRYQWQVGGISIPNATNATFILPGQPYHTGPSYYSVIAYNPMGYVISTNALLTIVSPPYVTTQPQSQAIGAGSNVTFTVAADGSLPLAYQWLSNGTNLPGATNTNFSITNVQAANAGPYSAVVANSYRSVTSDVATLTVVPSVPFFLLQPQSQAVAAGTTVSFTAGALGTEPISYQWRFNGTNLPGGTSNLLSLVNAQITNSGDYSVLASNFVGATFSTTATLVVTAVPPAIVTQPRGCSFPAGLPLMLNASASGTAPLSYQWHLNGANIPGATSNNFTNPALTGNDFGAYQLIVTNAGGSATSAVALVTLGPVAAWGNNVSGQALPPPGLSNVVAIAGGSQFSLALKADGSVIAWGSGPGTNVPAGLNAIAIAAGSTFGLAVRADGTVAAWGSSTGTNVPVATSNAVTVAGSSSHGLALRREGTVIEWGTTRLVSVPPPGILKVTGIADGNGFSLACRRDGTVVQWGSFFGLSKLANDFVVVPGLSNVVSVAAGFTWSLALKSDGQVAAWGSGTSQTNVPASLTDAAAVATSGIDQGAGFCLALRSNGLVVAWGSGISQTNVPGGLSNVVAIATGSTHALALVSDGSPLILRQPTGGTAFSSNQFTLNATVSGQVPLTYAWSLNGTNLPNATNASYVISNAQPANAGVYGLIASNALGVAMSVPAPVTVMNSAPFILSIPTNRTVYFAVPLLIESAVAGSGPMHFQWQFNGTKLAGATNNDLSLPGVSVNPGIYTLLVTNPFGSVISSNVTVKVLGPVVAWGSSTSPTNVPVGASNAVAITAGNYYGAMALKADGTVVAWNYNGEIGVPPGLSNVMEVAANGHTFLALKTDGSVFGWSSVINTNSLATLSNIVSIEIDGFDSCTFLRADGSLARLSPNSSTFTYPDSASNIVSLAPFDYGYVALRAGGTLYVDSQGGYGIPQSNDVAAIAAGGYRAGQGLLLRRAGSVVSWGPTNLPPVGSNCLGVAASYYGKLAIRSDGTVAAWAAYADAATNIPSGLVNVSVIDAGTYHAVALLTKRSFPPVSLFNALNTTNLVVSSKGSPQWFGQTNVTHDGADAAQSAEIGNNTASSMRLWVAGPITVNFWWKVSSETNHDFLSFYAGGVLQTNISGETGWQSCTVPVPPGNQLLVWTYSKDGSGSAGQDAGWVDQLQLIPQPPVILTQPIAQQVVGGTNVTFTVSATGTPALSYRWRKDGSTILVTGSASYTLSNVTRTNSGTYSVVVTNIAGNVTSSNAVLAVHVPQHLGAPVLQPDGSMMLTSGDADGGTLAAADLANLQAQVSTNLVDWIPLPGALTLTNGLLQLQDPGSASYTVRFYRILENW